MESPAYLTGQIDAFDCYGLEKEAYAKAIIPLAGAALGALAAEPGETLQGALAGGAAGLGAQYAGGKAIDAAKYVGGKALGAGQQATDAIRRRMAKQAPQARHVDSLSQAEIGQLPWRAQQAIDLRAVDKKFEQKQQARAGLDAELARHLASQQPSQTFSNTPAQPQQQNTPAQAPKRTQPWQRQGSYGLEGMVAGTGIPGQPQATPTAYAAPPNPRAAGLEQASRTGMGMGGMGGAQFGSPFDKESSLRKFKLAFDFSLGLNVPGTPLSVNLKDQKDRLEGMTKWVPREDIERGYQYVEEGTPLEDIADEATRRGGVMHPLLGAALAAAATKKFAPGTGAAGPALAGVLGAGAGSLYNKLTEGGRVEDALQGYEGARRSFPLRRHGVQTANESKPLLLAGGRDE